MGELNATIEKIDELMQEEKRILQRRERLKDEIRGYSIKVEKKMTHKKIVVGAALLAELLSSTLSTYDDYKDYICSVDDKTLEKLGRACAQLLNIHAQDFASLVDEVTSKTSSTNDQAAS